MFAKKNKKEKKESEDNSIDLVEEESQDIEEATDVLGIVKQVLTIFGNNKAKQFSADELLHSMNKNQERFVMNQYKLVNISKEYLPTTSAFKDVKKILLGDAYSQIVFSRARNGGLLSAILKLFSNGQPVSQQEQQGSGFWSGLFGGRR